MFQVPGSTEELPIHQFYFEGILVAKDGIRTRFQGLFLEEERSKSILNRDRRPQPHGADVGRARLKSMRGQQGMERAGWPGPG
jgi:hypothetical protein